MKLWAFFSLLINTEQITEQMYEMCTSEGFACTEGNSWITAQNEGCKTPVYILSIIETSF